LRDFTVVNKQVEIQPYFIYPVRKTKCLNKA